MSGTVDAVLAANAEYAVSFGDKGKLPGPPARKFAILTCMDARLDPAKFAGLAEGDAHVIRNAGGRASDDAIRSLVISHKLLGTQEWFVIHHTLCGMQSITNAMIGDLLEGSLGSAVYEGGTWKNVDDGPGTSCGKHIDWLTFRDLEQSVRDDVKRIRKNPMVSPKIRIHGFLYDCETGKLEEVPGAGELGKPTA